MKKGTVIFIGKILRSDKEVTFDTIQRQFPNEDEKDICDTMKMLIKSGIIAMTITCEYPNGLYILTQFGKEIMNVE